MKDGKHAMLRISALAITMAGAYLMATAPTLAAEPEPGDNCGAKLNPLGGIVHAFNQAQYLQSPCDDDGEHEEWKPDFCGEHHFCLDG